MDSTAVLFFAVMAALFLYSVLRRSGDRRLLILSALILATAAADWFLRSAVLVALLTVASGVSLIVLRKPFSREAMASQERMWGRLGWHFGQRDVRTSVFVAWVVGIGFALFGLARLVSVVAAR